MGIRKKLWLWLKRLCDPGRAMASAAERRRIFLTNITITLTILMNFLHLPVFLLPEFLHGPMVVGLNFCVNVVLTGCLILNRQQKEGFGKKAFFLLVVTEFTYIAVLLGTNTGIFHYFTCAMLASFLAFSSGERRAKYLTIVVSMVLYGFFIFCHLFAGWFTGTDSDSIRLLRGSSMILSILINLVIVGVVHHEQMQMEWKLNFEYRRSEHLLDNIFPRSVSAQLKNDGHTMIADRFHNTTILFADIVGFTKLTESMGAEPVVALLNRLFSYYDDLAGSLGLEKIKTIGDAYMVAAGVPQPCPKHCDQVAEMALKMLEYTEKTAREADVPITVRIGINSGTVVAGVIGKRKFQFDIWGDCVNTASRMESTGIAGKIQVSESSYELLKENWDLKIRGVRDIKGLGKRKTWFLRGVRSVTGSAA